MNDGFYTWGAFRTEVFGLMPLEKDRLIQGDDGQFMERLLKLAVIDLQKFVKVYRLNHETIYLPTDFVVEGSASHGTMPPNATFRDVWMFDTSRNRRYPVIEYPWEGRFEMVNARMNIKDNNGRIAIDPYGYTFYLYPLVRDGWMASVFWDGIRTEFLDTEETPFDSLAVDAAADFIKGHLARQVQGDLNLFESYLHPSNGSYVMKRRDCYLNSKERKRVTQ